MKTLVLLCLVAAVFALPEEYDCPANSHFDECGTACPVTCDNYMDPPWFCVLMCNPGCHCDKGYVRIKKDVEECLKPDQCPNDGNDLSEEEESACDQPRKVGRCSRSLIRYFFNKKTGSCEEFTYSGCAGNDNNFDDKEDCEAVCMA